MSELSNPLFLLAFVVTPAIVVMLGFGAAALHKWDLRRTERRERESLTPR